MEIAKSRIVINNQEITYHQLGQGKPILFLHGGRVRALTFKKLLEYLARNNMVIAPDIPGYGESPAPEQTWSFINYANFFKDFIQKLNLSEVTVVGYSMGGGIAINLAAINENISQLVLINASGLHQPDNQQFYHDMRRLLFYITHPYHLPTFYILLKDYFQYIWQHRNNYNHMTQIRGQCLTTPYDNAFNHISIPVVLLWGRQDWIYPISIAHEFKKRLPQAELIIVNGNHDWLVYSPLPGIKKIFPSIKSD